MKEHLAASISDSSRLKADVQALKILIASLSEKHHLKFEEALELLKKEEQEQPSLTIPSSIFTQPDLGIVEALTKYLKEENNLTFHEIALLLKKDDRVVWTTYHHAIKKVSTQLSVSDPSISLPISIFADKTKGPLQTIASYLKDHLHMRFTDIGKLLARDPRVIWTVYHKKRSVSRNQ